MMKEDQENVVSEIPKAKTGTEASSQFRDLRGGWLICFKWIAYVWIIYQVCIGMGFISPNVMSFRALHLIFALMVTFLAYPVSNKKDNGVGIIDLTLIGISIATAGYVFYINQYMPLLLLYRSVTITPYETVLGVFAIIVILEGSRRIIGWILPVITVIFIFYGYISQFLPGVLWTRGYGIERIIYHVYMLSNGIWGLILGTAARDVFPFVLFATFFLFSGVGEAVMKVAMGQFGSMRGGPAKAAVVASGFFGMLSGSAVANIMTTGSFSIPLMKKLGYSPKFAAAVEACASTGGMFTPPFMGAAAFIMAQYLGVSYGTIVLITAIPALLFYLSIFFAIDAQAKILKMEGIPKEELPNAWEAVKKDWYLFLPLVLLIYLLVVLYFPPARAALYGIASLLVVYLYKNRSSLDFKKILIPLENGARVAVSISVVTACIGILVGMIELTGVGVKLSSGLIRLSGGSLPLLLVLTMLSSFLLGMGLVPSACYITLAIMVAPALVAFGIEPLAAHYFVFVFGMMAMITPPVSVSSYVAASLAGANMFATGITGFKIALPFFIVPYMIAYHPTLIGLGAPLDIVISVITAIIGIWAFCCGIFGVINERANIFERLLLFPGAIFLIQPITNYNIIGVILVGTVLLLHNIRLRRSGLQVSDIKKRF